MKLTLDKLKELFQNSENCDKKHFAEMRTNIKLQSGDHFSKLAKEALRTIKDNPNVTNDQKIRLVKNHIQKITKIYINSILSAAPSVIPTPKNKKELQDIKCAEINLSIWNDIRNKVGFKRKNRHFVEDMVVIGEECAKIFFNPSKGAVKGYAPIIDEMTGQPKVDEMGQPIPDESKPVFEGEIDIERIFAFDLLRDPSVKEMDDSPYLIYRKLIDVEVAKSLVKNEDDRDKISASAKDTFSVFNASNGEYEAQKNKVLVKEYYFKPDQENPNGYYVICTDSVIIDEGELPGGIFPIIHMSFDDISTLARGFSLIKNLRPTQVEINRAASKIAEHQVTLGDDKLITSSGSKIAHGGTLPGLRHIQVSGMAPTILQGRTGDQFLPYLESQITELYNLAGVREIDEDKMGQQDPYTLLFRSGKDKKKYSLYVEKHEQFLTQMCEICLKLAKLYYDEDRFVEVVGRRELVNIAEFKSMQDIGYSIEIEPMGEDMESMLGKQLTLNTILQYASGNMSNQEKGMIIKNMPYANSDEIYKNLTLDYENATNDILALDRGEIPQINKYDDHSYIIKQLSNRTRQSDFKTLAQNVQDNYFSIIAQHEKIDADQKAAELRAKQGLIPTGGYMVKVDFYVPSANDSKKLERASLPYEAIVWLMKQMETQGYVLSEVQQQDQGVRADYANLLAQQGSSAIPQNDINGAANTPNGVF